MPRENSKWGSHKGESTDAEHRGGAARSSVEASVMEVEPRGCVIQLDLRVNPQGEEPVEKAKPFDISKSLVWEAYLRVRSRKGAPGVDEESIEKFEENLKDNLYKLWNRMSSGSYFPAPVRRVEIPKKTEGVRLLGIPTVTDRIAQTVVKMTLEPILEPHFHDDSYAGVSRFFHRLLRVARRSRRGKSGSRDWTHFNASRMVAVWARRERFLIAIVAASSALKRWICFGA